MKILHTGDWHIGKIVNDFHMTPDQRYVMKQFINIIENENPDVIVIAGDLYDRSVAPVEAVELVDEVFSKILLELNKPIIAIAGNHDSPERLSFGSSIFENKGLYIEGTFSPNIRKVVIEDEFGPVNFYMLPYADPAVVRDAFEDESIKTHDDAFKAVIDKINQTINLKERNVLVAHGFVVGDSDPELSESERPLSIGGTDFIKAKYFENFNYTALGHLHGPQRVLRDNIRYSGSILKYSFSEVRQNKSVTIINMGEKGEVAVELKKLVPIRDMRIIKGEINELLSPEVYKEGNVEDYLSVTLTDEGELVDPIGKLRSVYHNVMVLTRETSIKSENEAKTSAKEGYKKKSKLELFKEFYEDITGGSFTEDRYEIAEEVIGEIEKSEGGF